MPKTLISRPNLNKPKSNPTQTNTESKKDSLKEFKGKLLSASGFLKNY